MEVRNFLQTARTHGCLLAIDDFGAGYSNFEYLLRLNVDFIKIARILQQNALLERSRKVSDVQLSRGAVPCQNDLAHNVLRMPVTRGIRNAASIGDFFAVVARA